MTTFGRSSSHNISMSPLLYNKIFVEFCFASQIAHHLLIGPMSLLHSSIYYFIARWDAFANEFFEDEAQLTLTFCLEDGPKRYSEWDGGDMDDDGDHDYDENYYLKMVMIMMKMMTMKMVR